MGRRDPDDEPDVLGHLALPQLRSPRPEPHLAVPVALLGIVRLFWPSQPERIVPVLGHVDATPKPLPTPTPKAKGWKLPWR
jgi:hypothetical protein